MRRIETTIAGIAIPDSALGREATEFVQEASTPLLFHHSRRVFLWAWLQAERLSLRHDPELLYVGAMFHDVGLLERHRSEASASRSTGRTPLVPSSSGTSCPRNRS